METEDPNEKVEEERETYKTECSNTQESKSPVEPLIENETKQSAVVVDVHNDMETCTKMEADDAEIDCSEKIEEERETNKTDSSKTQEPMSTPEPLIENETVVLDVHNDVKTCTKMDMDDSELDSSEKVEEEREHIKPDCSKTQISRSTVEPLIENETQQSAVAADVPKDVGDKMTKMMEPAAYKSLESDTPLSTKAPESAISLQMECEEIEPEIISSEDEYIRENEIEKITESSELKQKRVDVVQGTQRSLEAPILLRKPYFFMMIPTKISKGILQDHMKLVAVKVKNMSVHEIPVWIVPSVAPVTEQTLESGKKIGVTITRMDLDDKKTDTTTVDPTCNQKDPVAPFDLTSVKPLRDAFGKKTGIIIFNTSLNHIYVDDMVRNSCDKFHIKEVVGKSGRIQIPIIAVLASLPVKFLRRKKLSKSETIAEQAAAHVVPSKTAPRTKSLVTILPKTNTNIQALQIISTEQPSVGSCHDIIVPIFEKTPQVTTQKSEERLSAARATYENVKALKPLQPELYAEESNKLIMPVHTKENQTGKCLDKLKREFVVKRPISDHAEQMSNNTLSASEVEHVCVNTTSGSEHNYASNTSDKTKTRLDAQARKGMEFQGAKIHSTVDSKHVKYVVDKSTSKSDKTETNCNSSIVSNVGTQRDENKVRHAGVKVGTSTDSQKASVENETNIKAITTQSNCSSISARSLSVTVDTGGQNIGEIPHSENDINMSKDVSSTCADKNGHAVKDKCPLKDESHIRRTIVVSVPELSAPVPIVARTLSNISETSEHPESATVDKRTVPKSSETSFVKDGAAKALFVNNSVAKSTVTSDKNASTSQENAKDHNYQLTKEHSCFSCGRNIILCNIYSSELRKEGFPGILLKFTGVRKIKRKEGYICLVCRAQVVEIHRRMKIFRTKYKGYADRIGRKVSRMSKETESRTDTATVSSEEMESSSDEEPAPDVSLDDTATQTEPQITGCYCNSRGDKGHKQIKPTGTAKQMIHVGSATKQNSSSMVGTNTNNEDNSHIQKSSSKLIKVFRKDPTTGFLIPEMLAESEVAMITAFERHLPKNKEKKTEHKAKLQRSGVAEFKRQLYHPSVIKENERLKNLNKDEILPDIDSEQGENDILKLSGESNVVSSKRTGVNSVEMSKKSYNDKAKKTETDKSENEVDRMTGQEGTAEPNQSERLNAKDNGVLYEADGVENGTDNGNKNTVNATDHSYTSAPPSEAGSETYDVKMKDIKKHLFSVRYNTTNGGDLPSVVFSCCHNQVPALKICDRLMESDYMREKFEAKLIADLRSRACMFHQRNGRHRSELMKKSFEDVVNISWLDIVHELFVEFPVLAKMIAALTELVTKPIETAIPQIAMAYGILMYARDKRFSRVQHFVSNVLMERQLSTEQLFNSFTRTGLCISYQSASKLLKSPNCPFNAEKILELRQEKREMQHERRRQYYARLRMLKNGTKSEVNENDPGDGETAPGPSTENQAGSKSKSKARKRPAEHKNQSNPKQLKLENGKAVAVSRIMPNILMKHFGQNIIKDQKKMLSSKYKPLMRIVKSPRKKPRKQKRSDQTDEQSKKRVCLIQTGDQQVKVAHVTEADLEELVSKQDKSKQSGESVQAVHELLSSENITSSPNKNIITLDKDAYETFLNKMSLMNNSPTEDKKASPRQKENKKHKSTSPGKSPSKDPSILKVHLLTPADLVKYQIGYNSDFIAKPPTDMLDLMDSHFIPDEPCNLYDQFVFDICDSNVKDSHAADAVLASLIQTSKNYEERVKAYPEEYPASKQALEWLQAVSKIIIRYKLGLNIGREETIQLMKAFMAYCGLGNHTILPRQMRVQDIKLMSEPTACYRAVNHLGRNKSLIIAEVHDRQCYGPDADTEEGTLFEKLAGELLLEEPYAFFFPYSFGMVFHKTTVMVARLQISRPHLRKLQTNCELQPKHQGTIIYSQCHDLLRKRDRLKVMRFLWRLNNGAKSINLEKQESEANKAAQDIFAEIQ